MYDVCYKPPAREEGAVLFIMDGADGVRTTGMIARPILPCVIVTLREMP